MKKIIVGLTAIVALTTFSPDSIDSFTIIPPEMEISDMQIFDRVEVRTFLDLYSSASNLNNKDYTSSLWHLNRILGCKAPEEGTLDEVVSAAEDVVDKYESEPQYKNGLLNMAEALYKQQKHEIATDTLKEEMEYIKKEFDVGNNFIYHLWMAYNYTLKKTGSVEETHERLQAFYEKEDFEDLSRLDGEFVFNYGDMTAGIFEYVEESIPDGESPLVLKIKSNYED